MVQYGLRTPGSSLTSISSGINWSNIFADIYNSASQCYLNEVLENGISVFINANTCQ